ncbi:MAG: CRISPR system precrRNA processing endoribonuclease RAMP protein Cas6 [Clostridiales Family XIII bacterium]|jgi:CRISPR-associated endoribonuclease Cas6|nr:CRISPR system precrRNA processing endoribonuclease RAMP protein Cas6 [Clostridiales Family XIII bacterium]
MRQIDLILESCDTRNLHPQLCVKLHGALMRGMSAKVAEGFHGKAPRPYSLFVVTRDDDTCMRVSALSEAADPILDVAMRVKEFTVSGLCAPVKVLGRTEHPAVSAEKLLKMPPLRDFGLELASPAVYKHGNAYRNMFSMEALLLTVAEKFNAFEGCCMDKPRIQKAVESIRYRNFALRGATYEIKHSVMLPACIGKLEAATDGPADEIADLSLLLRYATYAGLGARTALGMGGILLRENKNP